jgi:hypothetical protein
LVGRLGALNYPGSTRPKQRLYDLSFCTSTPGIAGGMSLSLLLIIIGIILALLVNYVLGILCIVIGLVLLVWPRITATGTRV